MLEAIPAVFFILVLSLFIFAPSSVHLFIQAWREQAREYSENVKLVVKLIVKSGYSGIKIMEIIHLYD